jgi:uncharacterized radical SAM superfamily protein
MCGAITKEQLLKAIELDIIGDEDVCEVYGLTPVK